MIFNVHVYTPTTRQAKPKYRYYNGNYASMNDQLNDVDWSFNSLMNNLSVQEAWTFFYTTYEKAMEQSIPQICANKGSPEKVVDKSYSSITT